MPLPTLKDQFAALIAAPSVSCTQPALDQSNRQVIDLLAGWLGDLGFRCDIQQVSPGKLRGVELALCLQSATTPVKWAGRFLIL